MTPSVGSESGRALLSPTTLPAAFHPSESTTTPPPLDRRACRPIVIGYWPLSIDRSRMPRARSLLDPVSSKSRRFIRNRAPGETRPLSLPFRLSRSSFTREIVLFGAVTTGRLDERVARFVEEETYGFIVEFE